MALAHASSDIAEILLPSEFTANSALKLPMTMQFAEALYVSFALVIGKVMQKCKLVAWDKCKKAHKKSPEDHNRSLLDLPVNRRPPWDALLVPEGDVRQTLPVIPRLTAAEEINAFLI